MAAGYLGHRRSDDLDLFTGARTLAEDSPCQVAPSDVAVDGMTTRSLSDLAADKTLAPFGRAATRDFVDVYVLLGRFELSQLMAWAQQKDSGFGSSGP